MAEKYFIGLDIGGTNLKFGILSSSGRIIKKGINSWDVCSGKENILGQIKTLILNLHDYAQKKKLRIEAVGIGSPGTVSKQGAVVGACPNVPDLLNTNLKKELAKAIGLPIYVDNDANCMAWGEFLFGAGKGYKDIFCLTIGTGIGGGIVLDKKLFHGSSYAGAEFGHMTICYNGRKCRCGGRGCLEKYGSATALVSDMKKLLRKNKNSLIHKLIQNDYSKLSAKIIFQAQKRGDNLASAVVSQLIQYLGAGIASVVNLLNPEIIVIGGGVADAGENLISGIEKEVRQIAFSSATVNLKIVKAKLGNDAGFIGAAMLAKLENN